MQNPIVGNTWTRNDIVFVFADDFSTITIKQGDQQVTIRGNDIKDVEVLMKVEFEAAKPPLSGQILWNMTRTSKSMPTSSWI